MEIELHFNFGLSNLPLLEELRTLEIPIKPFNSLKHHKNTLVFYRKICKRSVVNPDFLKLNSKVVLIVLESSSITQEMGRIRNLISLYKANSVRVILLIEGVKEMLEAQHFTQSTALDTDRYQEWLAEMMISDVEVIETDHLKETVDFVARIANTINDGPYRRNHTVFELKSKRIARGPSNQQLEWIQFLINIPGVSMPKAEKIVQAFPTMQSLMQLYLSDISEKDKAEALASVIDKRKQLKLSRRLHTYFTCTDPNFVLK